MCFPLYSPLQSLFLQLTVLGGNHCSSTRCLPQPGFLDEECHLPGASRGAAQSTSFIHVTKIEQVHFRHEALMLVELSNGAQLGWSTLPGLTALLGDGVSYLYHRNVCSYHKLYAAGL